MEIYELKKKHEYFENNFNKLTSKIDSNKLTQEISNLSELINEPNFWNDPNIAAKTSKKHQELVSLFEVYNDIKDNLELFEMYLEETDQIDELINFYNQFESKFKKFEINILLNGEYDSNSAILEIHPGAGGTESQDWANMLLDMYIKFFNKSNYKFNIIDQQQGDVAGIKSVTVEISGDKAFGYLKGETGIHRLVRISPFDSNKKRHTSFASVSVAPLVDDETDIEIIDSDLKFDYYRSSGAGGQSVNTTDSAVRITHLPSNIVVTCQNERSQIQNKEHALKILKSRLIELELKKQEEEKNKMLGEQKSIDFGSQKRSYVLHPYKMVKDHHTNCESTQADKVLNGEIDEFLYYNLLK